jgi:hypothetical protein
MASVQFIVRTPRSHADPAEPATALNIREQGDRQLRMRA